MEIVEAHREGKLNFHYIYLPMGNTIQEFNRKIIEYDSLVFPSTTVGKLNDLTLPFRQ